MSSLGDAMNRKIKQRQDAMTPEERAAAEEARKLAAEEAKRRLGYGKGEPGDPNK